MKKDSIEKRSLQNTIAGILSFGLSIIQSILLVPILLAYWGEEKYALWIALWAFVSAIRLFDLGFLSLIGNEFTIAYHKDKQKAATVLGSAVRIAFITGSIELVTYAALWYLGLADDITGIPNLKENSILFLGILISLFPWALGGAVLGVVLRAIPALGLYSKMLYISILMKIAEISILVIGGFQKWSLFSVSIALSTSLILYAIILNNYLKKIMPDFYPWWGSGSWRNGFILFKRSLALTINNILEQYINNGIIITISKTLGIAFLPIFTTIRTITNTASQATNIILDPLYPDMIRFHVLNEHEKLSQLFLVNWLILGVIINVPFAISILFIEPLFTIWTSHKLLFNAPLFYLLTLTVSISAFGRPMIIFIKSLNLLTPINTISTLRFIITFGLSIPFLQDKGLLVLGFSLLAAEIVCSILLPIAFIYKYIPRISSLDFLLGLLPTLLLGSLFLLAELGIHYLLMAVISFVLIEISIFYFQWNRINSTTRNRLISLVPLAKKKNY